MRNIYELNTAHGARMVVRKSDGRISNIPEDKITNDYAKLYLYSQGGGGGLCYITSDPDEVLQLWCDGYFWPRTAIPLEIFSGAKTGSISLADRWRGEFLCALPPSDGGGAEINRSAVGDWESFIPVEVASPPVAVAARCREILSNARTIAATTENRGLLDLRQWRTARSGTAPGGDDVVTANMFLDMLSEGRLGFDMTDAVGRRMPLDECKRLAAELDARPDLEDALARANPHDRWATDAIPALGAWLRGGRSPGPSVRTLTSDFDFLARAGAHGKIWSFPMLLNALRRQAVQPTRQACILATARNEGIYFIEWIAHHRAMGFEAFFIYTNDNTDGSDQLLEILASEGVINLIHNQVGPNTSPQFKAYDYALQFAPEVLDYAWIAAIDLDEFIQIDPNRFDSIEQYLNWPNLSPTNSVGLSWRLYGPNKHVSWQDVPVSERFTYSEEDKNGHVKSIFKTGHFFGAHCHFPYDVQYEPRIYRYSNGNRISEGAFYKNLDYEYAWIDHFHLKSLEEMVVRRTRNRGDHPVAAEMDGDQLSPGLVRLCLDQYDLEASGDRSPDDALDQKRRAEMQRLMGLPGVSAAVDRCKSAFREEVKQVKSILAKNPRFQTPGALENRLLELLLSEP